VKPRRAIVFGSFFKKNTAPNRTKPVWIVVLRHYKWFADIYPRLGEADPGGLGACPQVKISVIYNIRLGVIFREGDMYINKI
jgi:hypothetical protein